MSVILNSAIPTQILLTDSEKSDITDYINLYRTAHQSPNLILDDIICQFAQDHSNYLLTNCLFQYSGKQIYGENIIYLNAFDLTTIELLKMSIDIWYSENSLYDFNDPKFDEQTGHFTCLVWKASTTFGIGFSIDKYTNTVVISMNTFISGNTLSDSFIDNVLPKLNNELPGDTTIPSIQSTPTIKLLRKSNNSTILTSIKMLNESIQNLKLRNPNRLLIIANIQNTVNNLNKLL